jgi:hypothetical protein
MRSSSVRCGGAPEGCQHVVPILLEIAAEWLQTARVDPIKTPRTPRLHENEACVAQNPQVLRNRRSGDREGLCQITD